MNEPSAASSAFLTQLRAWRAGDHVRDVLRDPGILGAGVRVALLDTGIDAGFLRRRAAERHVGQLNLVTLRWSRGASEPKSEEGPPSAPHGSTVADVLLTVVPAVTLISIDIFGPRGEAEAETLAAALHWAAANRIQIVNVSVGVAEAQLQPPLRRHLLWRAVEDAYHHGTLVVAAAHHDHPQTRGYPAAFSPPLLSVACAGRNCGEPPMGLAFAPHDRIEFVAHSRAYCGPFHEAPASSWAAPHVSAAAAKLLELEPTLLPFELKTLLYWAATKTESC